MTRDAIVERWLAHAFVTYPEPTARFLGRERDPFRNPVGQAFREALPVLLDEALGGMDPARISAALGRVMQIRAVQDFTPAEAVAFVPALKMAAREARRPGDGAGEAEDAALAALDGRIDEITRLALEVHRRLRERLAEIRARDARRGAAVLERMRAARGGGDGVPAPAERLR